MDWWHRSVRRQVRNTTGARRRWGSLARVALALVACAAPAFAPPAPADAPPAPVAAAPPVTLQPLRVAYTALVSAQAPLWIAIETGLFREQGLDVEATLISGSDKAIAAL